MLKEPRWEYDGAVTQGSGLAKSRSLHLAQGLLGSSPNCFNEVKQMASSMEGTSEEKMPLLAEEGKAQEPKADADEACLHSKMQHDSWVDRRCIVMYLFNCFFWTGVRSRSQFAEFLLWL